MDFLRFYWCDYRRRAKVLIPCGHGHVYWSNRYECPGCHPMPKKWHLIDLALLGGIIFWLKGGL